MPNRGSILIICLTLAYRVPRNKYPSGAQQTQFHRQVVANIQTVPGVLAATSVLAAPLGGNWNSSEFLLAGQPEPPAAGRPRAFLNLVDPDFLSTMRIRCFKAGVQRPRPTRFDAPSGKWIETSHSGPCTVSKRFWSVGESRSSMGGPGGKFAPGPRGPAGPGNCWPGKG